MTAATAVATEATTTAVVVVLFRTGNGYGNNFSVILGTIQFVNGFLPFGITHFNKSETS